MKTPWIYLVHYKDFGYELNGNLLAPVVAGVDDNIGPENIAERDAYSEMRMAYWLWKNRNDAPWTGLHHYRRVFDYRAGFKQGAPTPVPINSRETFLAYLQWLDEQRESLDGLMQTCDMVVAAALPQALIEQYIGCHRADDWTKFAAVIQKEGYGDGRLGYGHYYNMFVMRQAWFDAYMTDWWKVMSQVEPQIELPPVGDYQRRVFGYLSERFMTVWINRLRQQKYPPKILELPVLHAAIE